LPRNALSESDLLVFRVTGIEESCVYRAATVCQIPNHLAPDGNTDLSFPVLSANGGGRIPLELD